MQVSIASVRRVLRQKRAAGVCAWRRKATISRVAAVVLRARRKFTLVGLAAGRFRCVLTRARATIGGAR
jgi:ribosomal protein L2